MTSIDVTAVIASLLGDGLAVQFLARGDSMDPLVRSEDMLHVEPIAGAPIRPGDVVLVDADRGLTAHRVIEHRGETIVTRGDNAPAADDPVHVSRILGRVTSLERQGRRHRVRRMSGIALRVARIVSRFH